MRLQTAVEICRLLLGATAGMVNAGGWADPGEFSLVALADRLREAAAAAAVQEVPLSTEL